MYSKTFTTFFVPPTLAQTVAILTGVTVPKEASLLVK
jgi:hypothetical protein